MTGPARALALIATTALSPALLPAQETAPGELVADARAITREMAGLRDLPLRELVDFEVSDRATIREFARASLEREMGPDEWDAYDALLAHTGLVPDTVSLQDLVLSLYTEQIAGYYDPALKTFYLADWLPRLLQRAVVAHEATHALQDQHFDLERWLAEVSPTEDGALARAAVTEGDAMAAMLAYLLVPAGVAPQDLPGVGELLRQNAGATGAAFPTFDQAPKALQRLLMFPYVEGADFVLEALRRGGWDAVDRLYRDPPASTEQVLHPERYWETRDAPRPLDVPSAAGGDSLLLAGSWGEFGVALVLEATLGDSTAARAAARGWDGDRFGLWRAEDGATVYRWSTVWDTPADAERFAEAYAQATVTRFPGSARITTGEGRFEFEAAGRSLALTRSGARVDVRERNDDPYQVVELLRGVARMGLAGRRQGTRRSRCRRIDARRETPHTPGNPHAPEGLRLRRAICDVAAPAAMRRHRLVAAPPISPDGDATRPRAVVQRPVRGPSTTNDIRQDPDLNEATPPRVHTEEFRET